MSICAYFDNFNVLTLYLLYILHRKSRPCGRAVIAFYMCMLNKFYRE